MPGKSQGPCPSPLTLSSTVQAACGGHGTQWPLDGAEAFGARHFPVSCQLLPLGDRVPGDPDGSDSLPQQRWGPHWDKVRGCDLEEGGRGPLADPWLWRLGGDSGKAYLSRLPSVPETRVPSWGPSEKPNYRKNRLQWRLGSSGLAWHVLRGRCSAGFCRAEIVCGMSWYTPMPVKNGSVVMHVEVSSNGLGPIIPKKRCHPTRLEPLHPQR